MANYAASLLATAQTELGTKFNEAELRRKQRQVLAMGLKNASLVIPNLQQVRTSDTRTVDVMYLKQKAPGATTAKAYNHTGTKGDSAKITPTWTVFVEKFYTSRKQAQNNVIGFQDMFNHGLDQAINNCLDRAETAALAAMYSARCQLSAPVTSGSGTWNNTNYALEIDGTNEARFVQYAKNFLRGRNYTGMYDMVVDGALAPVVEYHSWQGSGNQSNLAPQFRDVNIAYTTETITANYDTGAALIMREGSFAAVDWNDPLNRQGVNEGRNNVGILTTMANPYGAGMFDISMYTSRVDESSNGGHAQDIKDEWEVALQVAFVTAPVTTSSDSPIHLIGLEVA